MPFFAPHRFAELRADDAGRNCIHADAFGRQRFRKRFGEAEQRGFGDAIGGDARRGAIRANGSVEQHSAAPRK